MKKPFTCSGLPNFSVLLLILIGSLVLTSCGEEEPKKEEEVLEMAGDYTGFWNSQTQQASFVNQPITVRLSALSETTYSGELFISGNFTSCCNSGDNDGSLFLVVEGDNIVSFRYQDIVPNCEGVFLGSGTISETFYLDIAISGQDCDGDHVGTITLEHK